MPVCRDFCWYCQNAFLWVENEVRNRPDECTHSPDCGYKKRDSESPFLFYAGWLLHHAAHSAAHCRCSRSFFRLVGKNAFRSEEHSCNGSCVFKGDSRNLGRVDNA